MVTLLVIAPSIPVTVSVLAVLFGRQMFTPGSEWSALITIISLYAAYFGAIQTYKGSKISQQIHDMDEEKEKKRVRALVTHKIPHVVQSLKMLVLGMDRTALILKKHSLEGKIQSRDGFEHAQRRILMHIETVRSIEADFSDVELTEHLGHLDGVIANLDEIMSVSQSETLDIAKFEESIDMVFQVMTSISTEHGDLTQKK